MNKKYVQVILIVFFVGIAALLLSGPVKAAISGPCSDCHTMHNSQNNAPMNFDASTTPNEALLRGSCLGCHGQATSANVVTNIPQVVHSNAIDLAGGNFGYVTGTKTLPAGATGDASSRAHNVIDINVPEATLTVPPGAQHDHGISAASDFTCAGTNGCHGTRQAFDIPVGTRVSGIAALRGSHHGDDAMLKFGTINETLQGDTNSHSYRFLFGVKGGEDPDWEGTAATSATKHNEYKGASTPMELGEIGTGACSQCHAGAVGTAFTVRPFSGTMSGLCATCHGNFHSLGTADPLNNGIGGNILAPFTRHPTDVVLPADATKEYRLYNTTDGTSAGQYNPLVPIARQVIPVTAPSATFTAGTDAVMCLSCHKAHASPYADILRFSYDLMQAGGQNSGGCFVCHTTKNAAGVNP